MKFLSHLLLKTVLFPLVLLVTIIDILGMTFMKVGCYVVGPIMLILAGCGIYGIATQTWYNLWIALGCEVVCGLAFFAATFIVVEIDCLKDFLISI
ncbi:MAG: hypothetical protein HUJ70_05910 [Pseudobutyrivibrio sp.]|nr:hypothetical protein [Pseudobutyrivibrio sp.]